MQAEIFPLNTSLTISSEAFLYLFLPILLFETAIYIDVRRLLADIRPIMLLAVVAVLASTFVIGFSLAAVSAYGLVACLLLAAIVSTTDPVAVVALFKDISVPHRLTLLVEGESLFNDAAAIAIFSVLMAMLTTGRAPGMMASGRSCAAFRGGCSWASYWPYWHHICSPSCPASERPRYRHGDGCLPRLRDRRACLSCLRRGRRRLGRACLRL